MYQLGDQEHQPRPDDPRPDQQPHANCSAPAACRLTAALGRTLSAPAGVMRGMTAPLPGPRARSSAVAAPGHRVALPPHPSHQRRRDGPAPAAGGVQWAQEHCRAGAHPGGQQQHHAVARGGHQGQQPQEASAVVALPTEELLQLRSMLEQELQLATCEAQLCRVGLQEDGPAGALAGAAAASDDCSRTASAVSEQATLLLLLDDGEEQEEGSGQHDGWDAAMVDVEAVMLDELAAVQAEQGGLGHGRRHRH